MEDIADRECPRCDHYIGHHRLAGSNRLTRCRHTIDGHPCDCTWVLENLVGPAVDFTPKTSTCKNCGIRTVLMVDPNNKPMYWRHQPHPQSTEVYWFCRKAVAEPSPVAYDYVFSNELLPNIKITITGQPDAGKAYLQMRNLLNSFFDHWKIEVTEESPDAHL